jgi:uncharacterized membrane protein
MTDGAAASRLTEQLGRWPALDGPARPLAALGQALTRNPALARVLHGVPIGHALHPLLTDLPLGLWMSSTALDALGPRGSDRAADRLLGLGLVAALPTAWTGVADWFVSQRGGAEDVRRIGTAHAALNLAALGLYATSWLQRRRGRRVSGVAASLAAGGVATVSGYLGGHLSLVLHVPSPGLADPERGA